MGAKVKQRLRWSSSGRQVMWAVVASVPLVMLVVLIVLGYVYQLE
jgi:hypothetical protein